MGGFVTAELAGKPIGTRPPKTILRASSLRFPNVGVVKRLSRRVDGFRVDEKEEDEYSQVWERHFFAESFFFNF